MAHPSSNAGGMEHSLKKSSARELPTTSLGKTGTQFFQMLLCGR